MDDVLVETASGRIRPGISNEAINTSRGKAWGGFFLRESGPVDSNAEDIFLLKHAVCLQLNEPGVIDWFSDGRHVSKTIEPGQITICPANKLHSASFRHEGRLVSVFFEPSFLAAVMDADITPDQIELRWEIGIDSPALRELILLLHAEALKANPSDSQYATAVARLIALHLVQNHSAKPTQIERRGGLSPTRLKKVTTLIQESLGREMTLQELADAAGLSVFHFSRAFRQSTGMSPFQFVLKCRVNQARKLLLAPMARIHDVALDCGFCDQAHLTRHFKKVTGLTPAAYMRTYRDRNYSQAYSSNVMLG